MRPSRIITLSVAMLVSLLLPAAGQAQTTTVEVADNSFQPGTVTVEPGGSVTWNTTGNNPHTITAEDGSFDQSVGNGATFEHTFESAGTYAYYCKIHGAPGGVGMSGTVVVEAASESSPASSESAESSGGSSSAEVTGSLTVADQTGDGTSVRVASVTIEGSDGFVVVHSDQDGGPGPVLGHAAISEGTTTALDVPMNTPLDADQTVWPMLHFDAGTAGTYEFPGADGPVVVDGNVVVKPLAFTVGPAAAADELASTGREAWFVVLSAVVVLGLGAFVFRRQRA